MNNREVYLFTATSNKALEKIVYKVLGLYQVMKFKSEFELVHKCSNLEQGIIKPFRSNEEVMKQVE